MDSQHCPQAMLFQLSSMCDHSAFQNSKPSLAPEWTDGEMSHSHGKCEAELPDFEHSQSP